MNGTGSTRTAMRWRSSETAACALALLLAVAGCVKPIVSGDFEPGDSPTRLNADEARDYLSTALRPECARLQQAGATPTGEARVSVTVAQNGDVVRSRLTQRTGDARIDELFGATAARMKFDADPPRPAEYTGRLRMGYSCSGSMAVGTIELF